MKGVVKAVDFGVPNGENGPDSFLYARYPKAADRIEGLYDHRNAALAKAAASGSTEKARKTEEEFHSEDNVDRMFQAILEAYCETISDRPIKLDDADEIDLSTLER